jgi:hypothetical protein
MLMSYTAGEIFTQTIAIQGRGLTADTEDRLNTFLFYQVLLRQEQRIRPKSTIHHIISTI